VKASAHRRDQTVEIHNVAGNNHHAGVIMVYLQKEKVLVEADVYNPPAPNAAHAGDLELELGDLSDNIKRLSLTVDQILPLHGRIVPLAECTRESGADAKRSKILGPSSALAPPGGRGFVKGGRRC